MSTRNKKKRRCNTFYWIFFLLFFLIIMPAKSYALGDFHLYAMPGAWAEDLPNMWFLNTHLRHFEYKKVFDQNGNRQNVSKVSAEQFIVKLGHAQRLNNQWQLMDVIIASHANVQVNLPGNDMSASGMGDLLTTNYVGWHNKADDFHVGLGFSLSLPVGDYDSDEPINIGENRWKLYLPVWVMQYRMPFSKGLLLIDYGSNIEIRYKNENTGWDDHDLCEINMIFTYYLSKKTRKLGFFVQPDYQFAINESKLHGVGQDDGDFYSFGGAIGVTYAPTPNCILNFKYSHELNGKELAPVGEAFHFMLTYAF